MSGQIEQERPRKRLFERWRLVSPTGAEVVSLRQLSLTERLRVTSPSIFTTANMFFGFGAVLSAFEGRFTLAAVMLAACVVFDILDGAVARAVGATSPFGIQLDSLADLISFGLAPAVLVHTWALDDYPVLAWAAAFLWLACAAFRLARFNVTIDPVSDKRYWTGLPSPGAAMIIMATIFALDSPYVGPSVAGHAILPVAVSVIPALLMVSTVRFRSFRYLLSPQTPQARATTGILITALVVGLLLAPAPTFLVVAYSFVATAPLGVLTAPLRARVFGPQTVAPPRSRMRSVFLPLTEDCDNEDCEPDDERDQSS